jgi:hypothetical protein
MTSTFQTIPLIGWPLSIGTVRTLVWRPHFAPRRIEMEHDYSLDGDG